jgi:hypothetical protein
VSEKRKGSYSALLQLAYSLILNAMHYKSDFFEYFIYLAAAAQVPTRTYSVTKAAGINIKLVYQLLLSVLSL